MADEITRFKGTFAELNAKGIKVKDIVHVGSYNDTYIDCVVEMKVPRPREEDDE